MGKETVEVIEKIHNYALEEIMGDRFGRYSKYIIQDRAIPDVRDGLKPVQRRIIYSMLVDKNTYDKPLKKCANAVGQVMGRFHPHGDTSIYDAIIHLSQDWKNNLPLVFVQGNNGSIDGDPPAAMRYTECRLAKVADELVKDINKGTVAMALNYSDTLLEPTVLPAKFPNLLVNGSTGISAGYATNIPPHNLGEIIDATIKRIDNPNCRLDTILDIVKGPDFPTGGVVEGKDEIRTALETGKGKVVVKGKYTFEKVKGKEQIIISEIPYDVNKQQLVKKIDDIRINNSVFGMAEVRDESDKDAFVRIAIDLKPGADKDLIIKYLMKNTDLQTNYNYNMVTIVNRRPKQLGILGILDAYIAFDREVVKKKSEYDLEVAKKEAHINEGLIKAISILDEVIATIRASKNKSDAENNLVENFKFTKDQAVAIVTLQLYRLTNTDIVDLQEKLDNLHKVIAALEEIINNPEKLDSFIKAELRQIKKNYAAPRKTEVVDEVTNITIDQNDLIQKENVMVVSTKQGYVKRVPLKSYSAANGEETGLKNGDYVINLYETTTLTKLLAITKMGNYLYVPVNNLPNSKWKDLGKHISNIVTMDPNDEIVASYIIDENNENPNILMTTAMGMVKRTNLKDFIVSRYNKAYTAMKLKDGDSLVSACLEDDKVLLVSKDGYYLSYMNEEIPLASTKSSGVKGITLHDGDLVVSAMGYKETDDYLDIFTNQKTAKRIKISDLQTLSRAKRGGTLMKKVKTTKYEIVTAFIANQKDEIGLQLLEDIEALKNTSISIMDLASTGSNISKKNFLRAFVFATPVKIEEVVEPKPVKEKTPSKKEIQQSFIEEFKI